MATTIITKYGSGAPAASDVVRGELAVDTENGRLYTETSGGAVIEIGLNPSGDVDVTGTVTADGLTVAGDGAFNQTDTGTYSSTSPSADLIISRKNTSNVSGQTAGIRFDVTGWSGSTTGGAFIEALQADGNASSADLVFGTRNVGTYGERVRITNDGNVGIGTDSPDTLLNLAAEVAPTFRIENTDTSLANAQTLGDIDFYQNDPSGTGVGVVSKIRSVNESTFQGQGALAFHTGTSGGLSEAMRIDSSGRLLINKTSSTGSLSLESQAPSGFSVGSGFYSGVSQSTIEFQDSNTTADYKVRIGSETDDLLMFAGGSERVRIDSDGNVDIKANITAAGPTLTLENTATAVNGQQWGAIHFKSNDSSTGASGTRASIVGTSTSFNGDGNITFSTAPASGSNTERMRIDSSGNVGIGTDSPNYVLNTNYNANATFSNAASDFTQMWQNSDVNGLGVALADDLTARLVTNNGYELAFNNGTTEAMRIDSSGNLLVGITSSPDALIHAQAPKSTYTDYGTVFAGGTDSNNSQHAISLMTAGNSLAGILGSNLSIDGTAFSQPVTARSSGYISFQNATTAGKTSIITFGGLTPGTATALPKMTLDGDGNLLVGTATGFGGLINAPVTTTDEAIVTQSDSTSASTHLNFRNPNGFVGSISTSGTATAYNTSSDYRLKENVVAMSGATERLKQLAPKRFNFIADADTTVDGFLAHEVADVVPEAVTGAKDAVDAEGNPEYQGIDQSKLVPLLVATIQELEARIAQLEGAN